jgi:hypothetical protein
MPETGDASAGSAVGDTSAAEFGPKRLKAVRQTMIDAGNARTHINRQADRVRRIFAWGVAEELVPPSVLE